VLIEIESADAQRPSDPPMPISYADELALLDAGWDDQRQT
jgi:hypothetical protein